MMHSNHQNRNLKVLGITESVAQVLGSAKVYLTETNF
jgi:hypothetical protein